MTNHPNRSRARLAQYGARLRTMDGMPLVEMVDPNDNARRRFQYRRIGIHDPLRGLIGIQRRVLTRDGSPMDDGSPWETYTLEEFAALNAARGQYHPILDPLGL